MIINVNWANMSSLIDTNPGPPYYWSVEDERKSNDPDYPDTTRYFIRQAIVSGDENVCLITIETPPSSNQTDWEDNYKSGGIETL